MQRVAEFEKVSFEQFKSAWSDIFLDSDEETRFIYDNIKLPTRATSGSAGYDFFMPINMNLAPGETFLIPTGIRVKIDEGWFLSVFPKSGLGFKYRLQLDNTVGVIDSDYYYSDNEGHMFVKMTNSCTNNKTIEVTGLGIVNSIDTLIANWDDIRVTEGNYYVMGLDSSMGESKAFITDNLKHENGNIDNSGIDSETKTTLYNLKYVYKVVKNIANVTAGGEYVLVNQSYQSVADNINLADGINTLKEVAHVLDLITNGSMDPTNPENAGIELAYSIAQNHVDIVELDRRLDKLEAGENAVRSLQEATHGPHLDLHLESEVNQAGKYYQDVTISATLNMAYTHSANDTVARETVFVPTWNANADNGDITLSYTVDGATTVPSLVDRTHEGLVTTSWALSYGVELRQAIVANDIELNKHLAYAHSYALINALDGIYTTSNSKLVCGYTQTNGKVEVSYRELPTDHIEASATIWGESGETALKVYVEVANNVVTEAVARQTPLFTKVANGEYLKLTDAECGAVTDGTVVTFFALKDGVMVAITTDNFGGSEASDLTRRVKGLTHKDHIVAYKKIDKYVRVDSADLTIDANGKASGAQLYKLAANGQPAAQVKYISATAVHHNDETYAENDGSNTFHVTAHITKISDATASNSGLADAYDVKNAIDNIFGWVDLSEWASNNPLNRTDAPAQP
jgi:dUTP pyrophosphatase